MIRFNAGNQGTPRYLTYQLRLDNQDWMIEALYHALASLSFPIHWTQQGDVTPQIASEKGSEVLESIKLVINTVGMVIPFAGSLSLIPDGALVCNGASYNYIDYPELARTLGFDPNDDPIFNVPDLRGRFIVGTNQGSGVGNNSARYPYYQGQIGSSESRTITTAQMPSHTHTDSGHTHGYIPAVPSVQEVTVGVPAPAAVPGATATAPGFASIQSASANIQATGGGDPIDITPPYYAMVWLILTR